MAQSGQTGIALVDVVRHAQNRVVIVVVVLFWFGLSVRDSTLTLAQAGTDPSDEPSQRA